MGLDGSQVMANSPYKSTPQVSSEQVDKNISHTLFNLLKEQASNRPQSPAILSLEREPLSYSGLFEHVCRVGRELRERGLKQESPVAIVLPNGPELATAFLSAATWTVSAPLNPAYGREEFRFYLSDLQAEALLVEKGSTSPAVEVAQELGLAVLELSCQEQEPAGQFTLGPASEVTLEEPSPDHTALILHTSGTTARPKIVPLSNSNLTASAGHIARTLELSPDDRCLNIMPLFHIHGLMAAVLSTMKAGGSVVCTSGFQAPRFFDWLDTHRPTWYTAVPTMHQAILSQAPLRKAGERPSGLRFLRSSSASLAPTVMADLEKLFGVPVIEAYGMTEASHQMASNPLPPGERKAGTVGLAAGPEVAVMNEQGQLLEPGQVGEVVIKGPNVTPGYLNNPEANAKAFENGWFRTGDQGVMDESGYLTLTGRLKEIINRGGEKISPREIDEVLLLHPAVAQAVAFALPDARLGEDVGAAVVLHQGRRIPEGELRAHVAGRLANFKVPRKIVILDDIPKGPTGKLQRVGLAEKLGLEKETMAEAEPWEAPRTEVEMLLAGIWKDVLQRKEIGRKDDFLSLGGDSILIMQVLARIQDELALELPLFDFFQAQNLAAQAELVEKTLLAE